MMFLMRDPALHHESRVSGTPAELTRTAPSGEDSHERPADVTASV
jgi:hypothetical protein